MKQLFLKLAAPAILIIIISMVILAVRPGMEGSRQAQKRYLPSYVKEL